MQHHPQRRHHRGQQVVLRGRVSQRRYAQQNRRVSLWSVVGCTHVNCRTQTQHAPTSARCVPRYAQSCTPARKNNIQNIRAHQRHQRRGNRRQRVAEHQGAAAAGGQAAAEEGITDPSMLGPLFEYSTAEVFNTKRAEAVTYITGMM